MSTIPALQAPERVPRRSPPTAGVGPWVWAWLAMLPVALLRAGELAESDTFWQIRAGQYTLDHRAVPSVDFLSWTMPGRSWTLNSWGFNVVLATLDRLAGLPGVALGCAVLVMVTSAAVLSLARSLGAAPSVAALVLVLVVGDPARSGCRPVRRSSTTRPSSCSCCCSRTSGAPPGRQRRGWRSSAWCG